MKAEDAKIRRFTQYDAPWLIAANVAHYAASDGFDETFAALVATFVNGFAEGHAPRSERGWITTIEGRPIGSIFCVDGDTPDTARLKLFYLIAEARGLGFGQRMLETCMDYARTTGRLRLVLRTHESHGAAGRIYHRNGFRLIRAIPQRSFGVDVVEQHFECDLT